MLIYSLLSAALISLLSLVGIFSLLIKPKFIQKVTIYLVSFAAGTLLGGAFFHLLPESLENLDLHFSLQLTVISFILFLFIEKLLCWRHCHKNNCHIHSFGYMSLLGDGVHNFIDGMIISASFTQSFSLGLTTSIAVFMHELPQEIGDFAVMIHAGIKKKKALLFNFLSALTAVLGVLFTHFLSQAVFFNTSVFLPIAAGGFLYISTSDLVPEIKSEKKLKKSILSFAIFIIGIIFMYLLKDHE